ncbi:hypothetical protein [Egbenema bharatensis]|uniref:hypothetical protein n=1 Tax=Egbenema bharatensis TaxID=3463334 RepID=UPI003A84B932
MEEPPPTEEFEEFEEFEELDELEPSSERDLDAPFDTDQNPLNPAGESIDRLIQLRINEDLWTAMLGDLPCLDVTEACVRELQEMAIGNSLALQAIDERVDLVQEKIDQARANNLRTISLGIFEPAVRAFFEIGTRTEIQPDGTSQTRRIGFIDRIVSFFDSPLMGINDIFAQLGLPLFRASIGGSAEVQNRQIAIADLEVKVAEIQNKRGELAQSIREQVMLQVLDFDTYRREFQISQEVTRRDLLRLAILEQGYRFNAEGSLNTPQYLAQINALDNQKAQTYRSWARMRSQLTRVKLLVLGDESF